MAVMVRRHAPSHRRLGGSSNGTKLITTSPRRLLAQPPPPSPPLLLLFVLLLPAAADGLKLYLTYASDAVSGIDTATAVNLHDVLHFVNVSASLSNITVELRRIPCDAVGERATAALWASAPDPPAAIVGGCCDDGGACQSALPQILYDRQRGSPMSLRMFPSLQSASKAMAALAKSMNWRKLTVVVQSEPLDQVAQNLLESLTDGNVFARLKTYKENATSSFFAEQPDYDALVWLAECSGLQALWRRGLLRRGSVLVPLPSTGVSVTECLPNDFDGFAFIEGKKLLLDENATVDSGRAGAGYHANVSGFGIRTRLAIDSIAVLSAACGLSSNGDLNAAARNANFTALGLTGKISFSAMGNRLYDVTILQYINGSVVRTFTYNATALGDTETYAIDQNGECHQAANAAVSLLGMQLVLGTGLAVAMIAFNWMKRKDRMIKLTSPNVNVVTCAGCVTAYISIVLLGLREPWIEDLQLLARLKQAGAFLLSTAMTIVLGSVFLKTWRIYRIFTKPHSKGTVTRDEHLLLMLTGLLIVNAVIHVVWLTTDPYACARDTSSAATRAVSNCESTAATTCTCRNAGVWYAILYLYKFALLIATAYCAARIRHVSHPSLNDSGSTFASLWSIAVASLSALPLLLCDSGRCPQWLGSFAALVLAAFLAITSSLLWQFVPKILWSMKNKNLQGQIKFRHTQRTKQSRPPKATDGPQLHGPQSNPPPRDVLRRHGSLISRPPWLLRGSRKSDGDSCVALLRQENECLKLKLKEKDETIRELTDRLFFGSGHFSAYVERKASTTGGIVRHSAASSSRDSIDLATPRWSAAWSSADDDDDDSDCCDDGVFVTDVPNDFAEASTLGNVAANEAPLPAVSLRRTLVAVERRRASACVAGGFSVAAFSTGVQLEAGRVLADDSDGGDANIRRNEAGAPPKLEGVIVAPFAHSLDPALPLSLLSDYEDEPDSGVYTASCSEKNFAGWPRSARRCSTDGTAVASGGYRLPPPPHPLPPLARTSECPATLSTDVSEFLVEPSKGGVATLV